MTFFRTRKHEIIFFYYFLKTIFVTLPYISCYPEWNMWWSGPILLAKTLYHNKWKNISFCFIIFMCTSSPLSFRSPEKRFLYKFFFMWDYVTKIINWNKSIENAFETWTLAFTQNMLNIPFFLQKRVWLWETEFWNVENVARKMLLFLSLYSYGQFDWRIHWIPINLCNN